MRSLARVTEPSDESEQVLRLSPDLQIQGRQNKFDRRLTRPSLARSLRRFTFASERRLSDRAHLHVLRNPAPKTLNYLVAFTLFNANFRREHGHFLLFRWNRPVFACFLLALNAHEFKCIFL
jgi:hypothetical protein